MGANAMKSHLIVTVVIVSFLLLLPSSVIAATLQVPLPYPTIQDAIDAALDGDTVLVAPGTYVENIDFLGKAITVKSDQGPEVTVIDGGNPSNPDYGSVVTFKSGEGLDSRLEGFTITNGSGTYLTSYGFHYGGGIFCTESSPTIVHNLIIGNQVTGSSGGIDCYINVSPVIEGNTISGNIAGRSGGGISTYDANPNTTIKNNRIYGNWAKINGGGIFCVSHPDILIEENSICCNHAEGDYPPDLEWGGGGIYCHDASPVIRNNYIAHNTTAKKGGGFYCVNFSSPIIKNNFIGGNVANKGGGVDC
jgi:hypothetical protein